MADDLDSSYDLTEKYKHLAKKPIPKKPIRYACPQCGTTMESDKNRAGIIDACPTCGKHIHVPLRMTPKGKRNITILSIVAGVCLLGALSAMAYRFFDDLEKQNAAIGKQSKIFSELGKEEDQIRKKISIYRAEAEGRKSCVANGPGAAVRQFVTKRLKCPSTANVHVATMEDQGDGMFATKGYVDAENAFGAMLRIEYECIIRKERIGVWSLVRLQISE